MKKIKIISCLLIISSLSFSFFGKAQNFTVQVKASHKTGTAAIVFLELPGSTENEYTAYNINDLRKSTTVQKLLSGKYVFIIPDSMEAGSMQQYRLSPKKINRSGSMIKGTETDSTVNVFVNKQPVLQYRKATRFPNADSPAVYAGSGFIHPLYSPDGKILTDDFPAGHAHQNGIFSSWTRASYKGDTIDFWNRHQGRGKTEHLSMDTLYRGSAVLQWQSTNRMVSTLHGAILQEKRTATVYPFNLYYLFDIELEQTNITSDTLFLLKYHYGGMAIRGNKEWNPDDKQHFKSNWQVLTDAGVKDSAANGTHANWVTCWGKLDSGYAGFAVFSAPENFRSPQAIRVHPTMPYWCFAPCFDGGFFIAPGQTYKARYRYLSYSGLPDKEQIEHIQATLQHPPFVQVLVQ